MILTTDLCKIAVLRCDNLKINEEFTVKDLFTNAEWKGFGRTATVLGQKFGMAVRNMDNIVVVSQGDKIVYRKLYKKISL